MCWEPRSLTSKTSPLGREPHGLNITLSFHIYSMWNWWQVDWGWRGSATSVSHIWDHKLRLIAIAPPLIEAPCQVSTKLPDLIQTTRSHPNSARPPLRLRSSKLHPSAPHPYFSTVAKCSNTQWYSKRENADLRYWVWGMWF